MRSAYNADSWYPGDVATLGKEVDRLLAKAAPPKVTGKPLAVISPHAGYRYSAAVAATAYACVRTHEYKRVIILGFSHRNASRHRGIDVPRELVAYRTPLGDVPIDRAACDCLLKHRLFSSNPAIDGGEHSIELQLPFLQRINKDLTLVPLLVGRMSDKEMAEAAAAILPLVDEQTLLVASSDFTHFGSNFGYRPFNTDVPNKLRGLAEKAAGPLVNCDYDGFVHHLDETRDTVCGRGPIKLLLRLLSMRGGAHAVRAAYDTSGRMSGDWTNSVTYQSFVFTPRNDTLNEQGRAMLLRIARDAAKAHLNGQSPTVDVEKLSPTLRSKGACFVTLENGGRLRGCIGNMVAVGPLHEAVVRNAVLACQDGRFVENPVTAGELESLHIEVSYLTPMKRVKDPGEIVVGRHGLLIALGDRRGVLLPQVAYERGWSRDEFLAQTCLKAGLPKNAWKKSAAEIYSFEAEVFGEPDE